MHSICLYSYMIRWKMFELDHCSGDGRVCLVFPPKPDPLPVDESGTIQLDVVPPTPQASTTNRNYPSKLRLMF